MPHEAEIAAAVESAARVRYSRDHADVNAMAAAMPFAATRAMQPLATHRLVLADALDEAGRHDEADLARDATKHLRAYHHPDGYWHFTESPPRPAGRGPTANWQDESMQHVNPDVRQYLDTALWASTGHVSDGHGREDEYQLSDRYQPRDFTDEAIEKAHHAVEKFKSKLSPLARTVVENAGLSLGHSLWLTRNGHGAGFHDWDSEVGGEDADGIISELVDAAHSLGEQDVDVDPVDEDTTHLHLSGGRE